MNKMETIFWIIIAITSLVLSFLLGTIWGGKRMEKIIDEISNKTFGNEKEV